MSLLAVVPTPIMRMAGVAARFVVTSCLAENTSVLDLAMRVFVELVKCVSMLAAIVARSRKLCYVLTAAMKSQATRSTMLRTVRMLLKSGLACSLALTPATVPSIVVFTIAKSLATLRKPILVIALVLLMS
jgi:hypothetical protein